MIVCASITQLSLAQQPSVGQRLNQTAVAQPVVQQPTGQQPVLQQPVYRPLVRFQEKSPVQAAQADPATNATANSATATQATQGTTGIGQSPSDKPPTANASPSASSADRTNAAQTNAMQQDAKQPAPQPAPPNSAAPSNSAEAVTDPLASPALTLADVVASTIQAFPQIEQARLQAGVAAGEATSARGFYDHKLQGYSLGEPTGYYENYRSGIGVARQLWWGGYLSAAYRNGRGDFAPLYKERETNKGGELKLAMIQPLLQGRAIDPARVEVLQANLRIQAVAPEIERQILVFALESSEVYWQWVAAGSYLRSQEELLKLAEVRDKQLRDLVTAGANKAIDLTFNELLIRERTLKTIETRQKFRELGVKLSFYLRDEVGQPLYPREEWVLPTFPRIENLPPGDFNADMSAALARRPELRTLSLDVQHTTLELRLAENQMFPQLDLISAASQDVGTPASSLNDKGQFELEMGIEGELPIQRRKARGKIQSTRSKLAQLDQKIRLQQDKIGVELMTARNALDQAALEVVQAEAALRSSIEVLELYTFGYQKGQFDLVIINLQESKVTEYQIKLVESREKWYIALAAMQAALGLDPLEQAINISTLR
ncbi:MAG: TolC family protein [Pirellulaceae bacterium]|nr:TolC family protein [Pirellulaceae bacterium]